MSDEFFPNTTSIYSTPNIPTTGFFTVKSNLKVNAKIPMWGKANISLKQSTIDF